MVFPKIDIVAALFGHENINSHQSVPFGSDLFGLRPEWISSLHSDASARRSRGSVHGSDVRHEIFAGRVCNSADRGRVASRQTIRPARVDAARPSDREYFIVSQSHGSERPRARTVCRHLVGNRVCKRSFGVRRNC